MASSFPLVRGRKMRVTSLDGCYNYFGESAPSADGFVSQVNVSSGFVSVAFTANTTDAEEIVVTNANGQQCVKDTGCPTFNGYTLEITFCEVSPCLYSMLTGQAVVSNAAGEAVGFTMNSKVNVCGTSGFALELWSGVPGVACAPGGQGSFGYLLLPAIRPGIIGDFTIENAAVSFVVSQAITQDGNNWGMGPNTFLPINDLAGGARRVDPLDPYDHLYVSYTTIAPPDDTDGCVPLGSTVVAATTGVAGTPGTWAPLDSVPPATAADAAAQGIVAQPATRWTTGQYVQGSTTGALGEMWWDGTAWKVGRSAPNATGATAGTPGTFTPAGSVKPDSAAQAGVWGVVASPDTAWTTGQYVQGSTPGPTGQMSWDGTSWVAGPGVFVAGASAGGNKSSK